MAQAVLGIIEKEAAQSRAHAVVNPGANRKGERDFREDHENAAVAMMRRVAGPDLDVEQMLLLALARSREPLICSPGLDFCLLSLSFLGGPCRDGKFDNANTELRIRDAGDGRSVGKQAGLGHAWDGVDLENKWLVLLREHDVHARVDF